MSEKEAKNWLTHDLKLHLKKTRVVTMKCSLTKYNASDRGRCHKKIMESSTNMSKRERRPILTGVAL